ncbi:MAG: hypothetical protein WAP51_02420 [Candidatus Sungiibacteriota bacterium]
MAPLITVEKCARFARVIQVLMNEKQFQLAAELLKAFAFDPISTFNDLERLEKMVANDEEHGVKDLINRMSRREKDLPPS